MLDENLPAFFLKPSSTGVKHHRDFLLSYHGSDPEPTYQLHYADPTSTSLAHKNCYAAAIFDAYNPEVLFGEVLARPEWSQPRAETPSTVPPPPQPSIPSGFTVQLYNPDQQIKVDVKSSTFGSDSYEFSMPQDVFRTPSASSLDHGQSDPTSLDVTPKINFVWRKEGKFSRDLTCSMTGKSTDKKTKSSKKDPDIAIALWRNMRELTIYEPNLGRVDMEDPKGLEVVLLLSAVVVKDLYFGNRDQIRELFNISDTTVSPATNAAVKQTSHAKPPKTAAPLPSLPASTAQTQSKPPTMIANAAERSSLPRLQTTPAQTSRPLPQTSRPPPPADPRTQWELDAETARLKAQADHERRSAERKRREQDKKDEAERKRLQRMVEEEERQARKRQEDIDKETERLRKMYNVKPIPAPSQPQRPSNAGPSHARPYPQPQLQSNGLYSRPSASASSVMMSGANGSGGGGGNGGGSSSHAKKKKSYFGIRSLSEEQSRTLTKKKSAVS